MPTERQRHRDATSGPQEKAGLPEGTTLRVYLYLLQQKTPASISDVRDGLEMSTSSLVHYHIDKLLRSGLVRKEHGGYLADKMVLKGFVRLRGRLVSTNLFALGFFSTTLALQLLVDWQGREQLLLFAVSVNIAALAYASLAAFYSASWLRARSGNGSV